jgi:hypothetical protein
MRTHREKQFPWQFIANAPAQLFRDKRLHKQPIFFVIFIEHYATDCGGCLRINPRAQRKILFSS